MSKHVLLIDDEPVIARAIMTRLATADYEVSIASNGQAGLDAAAARPPDVILLDVRMPGMNGFEVCRKLKAETSLAAIPVIFMSANVQEETRKTALEVGGFAFVPKPFEPSALLESIAAALASREGGRASSRPGREKPRG